MKKSLSFAWPEVIALLLYTFGVIGLFIFYCLGFMCFDMCYKLSPNTINYTTSLHAVWITLTAFFATGLIVFIKCVYRLEKSAS
jgi:hypothetical protein